MSNARPDLFVDVIRIMCGGQVSRELDQELNNCVHASRDSAGKKAKLTLQLTLEHRPDGTIKIVDNIKSILPKPDRASIMEATYEGNIDSRGETGDDEDEQGPRAA